MKVSNDGVNGRRCWAINGRFLTQHMTGVQRYAQEIVAALDDILSEEGDVAGWPGLRLILPRPAS
jgi:hypothetical protein